VAGPHPFHGSATPPPGLWPGDGAPSRVFSPPTLRRQTHATPLGPFFSYLHKVSIQVRIDEPRQDGGKQNAYIDINGADGALAEYRAGDQIIQRDSNICVIYILKDHLGSCGHKVLENNGLWRYEETTPFGQTVMSGYRLNTQQKKFVGKEQDESGLYYYGARYYDSWQCRFVCVDPLWREYPYYTPYQYAGNRPMNYIDLDGLEPAEPPGGRHTAFNPPDTLIHVTPTDEVAGVSNQIQVDNILYNQLPHNPVADMAIEFMQGIMDIASDMAQQAVLEGNMARYSTNSTFTEPDLPDASNTTNTPELTTDEIDPFGDRYSSGGGMTIHDVLDVIGLIPVLGELADLTNASLYAD